MRVNGTGSQRFDFARKLQFSTFYWYAQTQTVGLCSSNSTACVGWMAGPRGFEPRIPGFHRFSSEGLHELRSHCVLILARLRARQRNYQIIRYMASCRTRIFFRAIDRRSKGSKQYGCSSDLRRRHSAGGSEFRSSEKA